MQAYFNSQAAHSYTQSLYYGVMPYTVGEDDQAKYSTADECAKVAHLSA